MPKVIVLTGTSRGLGQALTGFFAAQNHVVLGCARSPEQVEKLNRDFGDPHFFQALDVADDSSVASWAEHLLSSYGPPDLLINNAAVINPNRPLWNISAAEFDPVIDVNIKGTANVIRHFLPAMVARQRGVIVNFSSGWGRSVAPDVAPYCASKWAIEGLTRALAGELPQGMAAIPLNPGIIDTDMLRSCWKEGAGAYPSPEKWAESAGPYILKLGPKDNGRPLTVPGN